MIYLTQAPGRQQTSLWDGSRWHVRPSVPLRRESSMVITLLFFFMEAVLMRGGDCLALGTQCVGLHLPRHLPGPPVPESHNYCVRASGVEREAGRGFACCPEKGPVSIPPCLSGPLLLPSRVRAGDLLLLMECQSFVFVSGMVGHGSTNLFPSHTP